MLISMDIFLAVIEDLRSEERWWTPRASRSLSPFLPPLRTR